MYLSILCFIQHQLFNIKGKPEPENNAGTLRFKLRTQMDSVIQIYINEMLLCQVMFTIHVGVMLSLHLRIQSYALSYALNNLHIALGVTKLGKGQVYVQYPKVTFSMVFGFSVQVGFFSYFYCILNQMNPKMLVVAFE